MGIGFGVKFSVRRHKITLFSPSKFPFFPSESLRWDSWSWNPILRLVWNRRVNIIHFTILQLCFNHVLNTFSGSRCSQTQTYKETVWSSKADRGCKNSRTRCLSGLPQEKSSSKKMPPHALKLSIIKYWFLAVWSCSRPFLGTSTSLASPGFGSFITSTGQQLHFTTLEWSCRLWSVWTRASWQLH